MKKLWYAVLILAVIALAVYFSFVNKEKEVDFRTEKVTRGDIVSMVTATGTVNAVTTVLVGTQVSGTVKEIYADFNTKVKKGQLIALIDPATFEAQVAQARANLLSAKANLEKSDATMIDTRRTMERNKELLSKKLIAQSDLDTAETNYETAKAQVSVSKAQVAQSEAALKIAESNLGYTKIISPVDGVVISRNVDVGQTVAASFQTPTLFTIAEDLTKMQIDASVDEADIGMVASGQDVEFTVDSYPDITFHGNVSQVRNAPITVENVVTYDVVIKVGNPELKLKPGMTANVSIILMKKSGVLKIPNAALRLNLSEGEKGKTMPKGRGVWVLEEGKPRRVSITTGISDGSYTELVSGDIREGQEVIVEYIDKDKDDNRVRPRMF